MKLLYRTAKEVESFIRAGCCGEKWIQAGLTLADMSAYVSALSSNLEFCLIVLCKDKNFYEPASNWEQFDVLNSLESSKQRAVCDQRNLLTRLEAVIASAQELSFNSRPSKALIDSQLANCLSGRLSQHLSGSVQLNVWNIDFPRLRQGRRLGSGLFGMVHKSFWLDGKIEVAEKMFYGSEHPSFMNEVKLLAGLAHPNIVPLLGYARDGSRCSIIMELMDGDLKCLMEDRLRTNHTSKSPLTLSEAVDMMLQIAEGTRYLHEHRVVHRDLKSQNILVKQKSDIDAEYVYLKVGDFGLSKTKENSITYSNLTPNTGTPRWMAPELMTLGPSDVQNLPSNVEQDLKYPFKVNTYSFGMVCYEILTGKVPFSNINSPREVKEIVLSGERPILPYWCPCDLKMLIRSCWESEATSRPSFLEICKRLRGLKFALMKGIALPTMVPLSWVSWVALQE